MTKLVDENNKMIPACNYDGKLYVTDPSKYKETLFDDDSASAIVLSCGICFTLFLLLFSLNFTTGGWHLGNVITFAIMLLSLISMYYYGSKWIRTHAILQMMQESGTPCYSEIEDGWKIFTSKTS